MIFCAVARAFSCHCCASITRKQFTLERRVTFVAHVVAVVFTVVDPVRRDAPATSATLNIAGFTLTGNFIGFPFKVIIGGALECGCGFVAKISAVVITIMHPTRMNAHLFVTAFQVSSAAVALRAATHFGSFCRIV